MNYRRNFYVIIAKRKRGPTLISTVRVVHCQQTAGHQFDCINPEIATSATSECYLSNNVFMRDVSRMI